MTKVLILYYSSYGHVETMARAVAEGARKVSGAEVTVKRVPELVSEDVAKKSGYKLDQAAPVAKPDELASVVEFPTVAATRRRWDERRQDHVRGTSRSGGG